MALCKKVLLVWCLLLAQSCALRVERAEAIDEPAKTIDDTEEPDKKHGMHDTDDMSMSESGHTIVSQRRCPQYHSCINRLEELQELIRSLKSERAVMMGTLKTIINKGRETQAEIIKATKQFKYLSGKYSSYERIIKPNEVKIAKNVHKIDAKETSKDQLLDMISKWRDACMTEIEDADIDLFSNDFGTYYIYANRDDQVTYFDAQERCRALGMDLLTIESQDEYDGIRAELLDVIDGDTGFDYSGFWIGLNTLDKASQLKWIGTGHSANNAFSYSSAWQEDEPDYGSENQYKVINWYVYDNDFGWSAEHELYKSCFVCKMSRLCFDISLFDMWLEKENLVTGGR